MVATTLWVGHVALSPVQATGIPSIWNKLFPEITCPPPVVGQPIVMYGVAKSFPSYILEVTKAYQRRIDSAVLFLLCGTDQELNTNWSVDIYIKPTKESYFLIFLL